MHAVYSINSSRRAPRSELLSFILPQILRLWGCARYTCSLRLYLSPLFLPVLRLIEPACLGRLLQNRLAFYFRNQRLFNFNCNDNGWYWKDNAEKCGKRTGLRVQASFQMSTLASPPFAVFLSQKHSQMNLFEICSKGKVETIWFFQFGAGDF